MNRHTPLPAASPERMPAPSGLAGRIEALSSSPRCRDCGAGDLSYRVMDEDTGCAYPLDDGEHYCRHCDTTWLDEDVLSLVPVEHLGVGRIAL